MGRGNSGSSSRVVLRLVSGSTEPSHREGDCADVQQRPTWNVGGWNPVPLDCGRRLPGASPAHPGLAWLAFLTHAFMALAFAAYVQLTVIRRTRTSSPVVSSAPEDFLQLPFAHPRAAFHAALPRLVAQFVLAPTPWPLVRSRAPPPARPDSL